MKLLTLVPPKPILPAPKRLCPMPGRRLWVFMTLLSLARKFFLYFSFFLCTAFVPCRYFSELFSHLVAEFIILAMKRKMCPLMRLLERARPILWLSQKLILMVMKLHLPNKTWNIQLQL
jgi:hypothetical protein